MSRRKMGRRRQMEMARMPLTNKEKDEIKRNNRNEMARLRRENSAREDFVKEYIQLCTKYRCCATLVKSPCVWKVRRDEKIYTLRRHFESIKDSLRHRMVT